MHTDRCEIRMKICDYGCGEEAKYQFKNLKWCCSKTISGCKAINEKQRLGNSGKVFDETRRKNISNGLKGRKLTKNHIKKLSRARKGKKLSTETKKKISIANTGKKRSPEFKINVSLEKRLTISKVKKKYPFFSKIEEMRYNPDKPGEKEVQVHCKNHNCPNSKVGGGWFTPTGHQFDGRRRALEDIDGNGGNYFYCSEECKNECPLYNLNAHRELQKQESDSKELVYTEYEYQVFRRFVLERDDYKCQYCGEIATDVHHEKPKKLDPFFSLDPDYAWSCCKGCHISKAHVGECSTRSLAMRNCK